MAQYYGIERSEEYLEHYGIKGMKWRVQKAIRKGDIAVYKKQYKKAVKKLERLEKKAAKVSKYAKKAIIKGAGTAASLGNIPLAINNPGIVAYRAAKTGYNVYMSKSSKPKAALWREEIEKTFDPGSLYENAKRKRRGRK